jgi:hypothetical protein
MTRFIRQQFPLLVQNHYSRTDSYVEQDRFH